MQTEIIEKGKTQKNMKTLKTLQEQTSDLKKQLGENIKRFRKARKMTQEQLAEMVGIASPNISYIENGKFAPSIETFIKIAQALGIEPFELYQFEKKCDPFAMKQEFFEALEQDDHLLYVLYKIFKAIRFNF